MTAFVVNFTGFFAVNYQRFFDVVSRPAIHRELLIELQRLKTILGYISLMKTTKAQPEMGNSPLFFSFMENVYEVLQADMLSGGAGAQS